MVYNCKPMGASRQGPLGAWDLVRSVLGQFILLDMSVYSVGSVKIESNYLKLNYYFTLSIIELNYPKIELIKPKFSKSNFFNIYLLIIRLIRLINQFFFVNFEYNINCL